MVALQRASFRVRVLTLGLGVLRGARADQPAPGTAVREPAGAADLTHAAGVRDLDERCRRRLRAGAVHILVDLSGVTLMDTKLVALLVALKREARRRGGQVEVLSSEPVRAWLRVCRLEVVLDPPTADAPATPAMASAIRTAPV